MTNLLKVNGDSPLLAEKCTIRFGGLVAVNELNMQVKRGEIYGLIGPNGAGKTTIFNLLTGVYEPTSGDIHFEGKRINGLRPYQISRLGVSRTFQNIRLFPGMSVLENVMTACHIHAPKSLDAVLRLPRFYKTSATIATSPWLLEIFDLVNVRARSGQPAVWPAASPGGCARARHQAKGAAAGRTGCWFEPVRAGRPDESYSADSGPIRAYNFARRTQHEGRHGCVRTNTGC